MKLIDKLLVFTGKKEFKIDESLNLFFEKIPEQSCHGKNQDNYCYRRYNR